MSPRVLKPGIIIAAAVALGALAALAAAGALLFLRMTGDVDHCLDMGGRWDHEADNCIMVDPEIRVAQR